MISLLMTDPILASYDGEHICNGDCLYFKDVDYLTYQVTKKDGEFFYRFMRLGETKPSRWIEGDIQHFRRDFTTRSTPVETKNYHD